MTKGRYVFRVRSYECGADGRMTLPQVGNLLQEAASLHAAALGFGRGDFAAAQSDISWVLTRLRLRMRRYPREGEEVTVVTFPRGGRRLVAWRDFELLAAAGEPLGVATSEWMVIDLASRKLAAVPERALAARDPANEPVLGTEPFARWRFPAAADISAQGVFPALHAHIDLNCHVNNVHYLEWMLEPAANRMPAETEVVFRSETFAGDEVRVEPAAADGWTCHRVFAPDGRDHVLARTR